MRSRRPLRNLLAVLVILFVGLSSTPAHAATTAARPAPTVDGTQTGGILAGACSATYLRPLEPDVDSLGDTKPPYEYRVRGRVKVTNTAAAAGCVLLVCEAEELSPGSWSPWWCTRSAVSTSMSVYKSYFAYVDCQNYHGSGYFRSYGRFDVSNVSVLGPERFVCTT